VTSISPGGGPSSIQAHSLTKEQTALLAGVGDALCGVMAERCLGRRQVRWWACRLLPLHRARHDSWRGLPPLGRPWGWCPWPCCLAASADQRHRLSPAAGAPRPGLLCWCRSRSCHRPARGDQRPRAACSAVQQFYGAEEHRPTTSAGSGSGGVISTGRSWGRTGSSYGRLQNSWQLFCTRGDRPLSTILTIVAARSGAEKRGSFPCPGRLLSGC